MQNASFIHLMPTNTILLYVEMVARVGCSIRKKP